MSELVRVKTDHGEATVGAGFAKRHGLTVLDKPAVDQRGSALPAKPKVSVAPATESKTAVSKEDSK